MKLFGSKKARDEPRVRSYEKPKRGFRIASRMMADNTLAGNEAIYAAVSRIANTMAMMPVHLYKGYELQNRHPKELLLKHPNPNMTTFEFIRAMEAIRNTEGNAYALILEDHLGQPVRLDVLDPKRVQPVLHPETRELWYNITLDDNKQYPLPGFLVINVRHMSANGLRGVRPIDVLRGTLNYDAQIKNYSVAQLEGVNQGVFLKVPNTALNRDKTDYIVDRFLDAYAKSGQRVVVLEGGLEATPFSQSPIDAHVLEAERIMRNRVATVYNIPPHMLGDYSDATLTTAEQQMQEYLNLCIMPIVQQWEQELNRKLLTDAEIADGYAWRFDVTALLRADTNSRCAYYHSAVRDGYMRQNEIRAREGLPPDENGNELMVSRDLIPLRITIQNPELLLGNGTNATGKEETD